jgi:RimJ/RimL family protein N-acetyltransferase
MTPSVGHALRGNSIAIGPVMPDDIGTLFLWRNDADAAKWDFAYRPMDCIAYAHWLERLGNDNSAILFAIRKLGARQLMGFVGFGDIHPVHRSAELGVRIGCEADRGKGYGKEAVALALHYAWQSLNLNRVQLKVFAHNTRAVRSYHAAGFEQEGVMRRAAFIDGNWVDVLIMSVLRPAKDADEINRPVVSASLPVFASSRPETLRTH